MIRLKSAEWRRLIDPKTMVIVAALLAVAGFGAVYIEVHERIDRALALRQGPPQKVAIQNFSSGLHQGPVGEVFVRAEAGFDKAVMVRLPEGLDAARALVIPLYSLSDPDRVNAAPNSAVMGLLFHPITPDVREPTNPRAFADEVFGPGLNGTRIEVNGLLADRNDFEPLADAAFDELGVHVTDSVLGIQPFAGRRTAMLGTRPAPRLIQALFIASLGLFAAAAAIAFQAPAPRKEEDFQTSADVEAEPTFHPLFAPIPTQKEIADQEREQQVPEEVHWATKLGRHAVGTIVACLRVLQGAIIAGFRRVKSRPSHREDEAL